MRNQPKWLSVGACLIAIASISASLLAPLHADDAEPPRNVQLFMVTSKTTNLSMTEKASRILQFGARLKTVDGFDPTILNVNKTNDPTQLRLYAASPGVTNLLVVDEHDASFTIEVFVSGDVKQLEALIRKAAPDSSVTAIKVKDSVLLTGWVNQPEQLTTIVQIAEQFHPNVLNSLRVSGIQQVQLQVKIMEVQRSKIRLMGFNFLNLRDHSYVTSLPGALTPLTTGTPSPNIGSVFGGFAAPITSAVNPTAATATFGLVSNDNVFQGFIEALKQESLLKILAEPNLITVNGRPASFLAGGQFPILIPQGLGTVSIQFKPFGVQLEFIPTVLGNGRLRMDVAPEVSEKDYSTVVTVNGNVIPGLSTRKVNTQVEMNFGQTLLIAGLISNQIQASTSKIPFLGELPFIGAAFRRVSHNENETELLIMVTPEFVSPLEPGQVPPLGPGENTVSPTDEELYGNGMIENARYAPDPEMNACAVPGAQPMGFTPGAGANPYDLSAPPMDAPLMPPAPSSLYDESLPAATPDTTPRASTRPLGLPPAPPMDDETPAGPKNAPPLSVPPVDVQSRNAPRRLAPLNTAAQRPVTSRPATTASKSIKTPMKPGLIEPAGAESPANGARPGLIAPQ